MKIISFQAENFKRLKLVNITPQSGVVTIAGPNGSGKSSVLDAVWAALGGAKASPPSPVRRGSRSASITLDLGDLVVKRRFTKEGGNALQVEAANGNILSSPQKVLDELAAKFTFDPLAFLRLDPKKQLETLRGIVTLDVDVEALEGANSRDFQKRADMNRDAKQLRARADAIDLPELDGERPKRVDVEAILSTIEAAATTNGEIEQRKVRREQVAGLVATHRESGADSLARAARLRAEAAEAEAHGHDQGAKADELQAKLDTAGPLPEPVDVTEARRHYDNGVAMNRALDRRIERDKLATDAADTEKKADALTAAMAQRTQDKADAIGRADMPVPGLGFGEDGVTLNDLPFEQASGAEQLRASMAIAMAMNPELRIVLIKDGALLDPNGLKLVADMAAERDFQVWLERVGTGDAVGIIMEDGEVASIDGQPAAEA